MACLLAVSAYSAQKLCMPTFLVLSPADTLVFEQINNGRDVGRNVDQVVMVDAVVVTRYSSGVIGHGRMRYSELVGQRDTFLRQRSQVRVSSGKIIIGILEPDDCNAVERFALDPVLRESLRG